MSAAGAKLRHTAEIASAAVLHTDVHTATWCHPDVQQHGVTFARSMDCRDLVRVDCALHLGRTEDVQRGDM